MSGQNRPKRGRREVDPKQAETQSQYEAMFKAVGTILNQVLHDKVHPHGDLNERAVCTDVVIVYKRGKPVDLMCTCLGVVDDTENMRQRLESALPGVKFRNVMHEGAQKFLIKWPLESYQRCLETRVRETEDGRIIYLYKDRIVYESILALYAREVRKRGVFTFLLLLCVLSGLLTVFVCTPGHLNISRNALSQVFGNPTLTFVGFPACALFIFAYMVVKERY